MKSTTTAFYICCGTLLLSGCASQNASDIQRKVNAVTTDDDGRCIMALYETGLAVDAANQEIAKNKKGKLYRGEYQRGMAAADRAARARQIAMDLCQQRYASLKTEVREVEKKTERLPGVNFRSNSADLTQKAKTVLEVVANRLVKEGRRVEIAGHTSNTGSAEYNMMLSQRRAQAVVNYLISKGVDPDLLSARGYGITDPIATNATREGRNANKRVELRYK